MPRVSVIIPCYNQGAFIVEAVNSVIAQTFTDWEIIIVNDGSTENETNELLEQYAPPKSFYFKTENKGVSAARNFAISKATGEYILPLDADDYIAPDYLLQAVEKFDNYPDLKLVYCKGEYVGDLSGPINLNNFSTKGMLKQNLIFCTALFRKKDWEAVGKYDETFRTGWEDWEFWLRLIDRENQVCKLGEVLFFYRIKKASRNASLQKDLLVEVENQLFKKHLNKYLAYFPLPISTIRDNENLKVEILNFENVKEQIYKTTSYRLGHTILSPFKWLKNINVK